MRPLSFSPAKRMVDTRVWVLRNHPFTRQCLACWSAARDVPYRATPRVMSVVDAGMRSVRSVAGTTGGRMISQALSTLRQHMPGIGMWLKRCLTSPPVVAIVRRCQQTAALVPPVLVAVVSHAAPVAQSLAAMPGRKFYRFLIGLLLGLVVGLAVLMAAALLPGAVGFTPLVVVSGSMEPTLHVGDIAVAKQVEPYSLQVGDVATYSSVSGLVTHRIVGIDMSPQGPFFLMKGDANLSADPRPIPADRVVAKVVYRIPRVGFLGSFTDSMIGRLFLIVAPVLVLVLMWLRGRGWRVLHRPNFPQLALPLSDGLDD